MASKRKTREVLKDHDAPEFFNSCRFWKLMEDVSSGKMFPQACGLCDGCRVHKHESLISKLLAETESAAATLSVTLTYDPNGDKPEGAEWLDYSDVTLFLKRLRAAGFNVRKFSSGEYGKKNGRAHWHLALFFQWDDAHLTGWRDEMIGVDWKGNLEVPSREAERRRDWLNFCPPLHVGAASKARFMEILDDPETLWVATVGYKTGGNYRQKWRFWPHGLVEAQLVSAPGVGSLEETNRGVRYLGKYFSKDPWKDTSLRSTEFNGLPEWVRQSTAYGPWLVGENDRTKWVRGNPYAAEIEARNLEKYASDDLVPLSERLKKPRHNASARGGLGAHYFRALGAWYAKTAGSQDALAARTFKLGPSYRKKHIENVRRSALNGKVPALSKRNQFFMGDTAFRQFGQGFNVYFESIGQDETTGPDHIFDVLETNAAKGSDAANGPMGYHLWNKSTQSERKKLEAVWADLPADRLSGIVPQRLQRLFEDTSGLPGWQEKRRKRRENDDRGKQKTATRFGDFYVIETTQKRFFYRKDLKSDSVWFSREILTVEDLDHALLGRFLPENARAARLEREGRGDQRLISDLDIRTVRKRIKAAYAAHCPF